MKSKYYLIALRYNGRNGTLYDMSATTNVFDYLYRAKSALKDDPNYFDVVLISHIEITEAEFEVWDKKF